MAAPIVSITWDSAPVRQAFGACNVVFDGVATVAGKRYRINGTATRGARKPEVMLRYLTAAKSGQIVPESALQNVRAAAVASALELLAPMRAELVAHARRVAERFGNDNPDAVEVEARIDAINPASLVGQPADVRAAALEQETISAPVQTGTAAPFVATPEHVHAMRVCDAWDAYLDSKGTTYNETRPAHVVAAMAVLEPLEDSELDAVLEAARPFPQRPWIARA